MTKSALISLFSLSLMFGRFGGTDLGGTEVRGVVADMDLHRPLRDVAIHTDRNHDTRTNYRGEFTIDGEFEEITFGLTGYLPLTLSRSQFEQTDTVFLLPRMSELDEVVVIGKAPQPGFSMKDAAMAGAAAATPPGGASFDLMQLLDFRGRRHAKRRKRIAKILEDYDKEEIRMKE